MSTRRCKPTKCCRPGTGPWGRGRFVRQTAAGRESVVGRRSAVGGRRSVRLDCRHRQGSQIRRADHDEQHSVRIACQPANVSRSVEPRSASSDSGRLVPWLGGTVENARGLIQLAPVDVFDAGPDR